MNTSAEIGIKKFYSNFDFEKMLTNPPKEIQEFLDSEILCINKLKPTRAILEVGCGYGRLLKILANKGENVIGIDFSKKLLDKAKKSLSDYRNVDLMLMNAKALKFPDKFFDYTLCLDATFGNMPGIELDVLQEMKRVTKENGKIFISVFSEKAKNAQIKNYCRLGLTDIHDVNNTIITKEGFCSRRFFKKEIRELFNKVGLSVKISSICSINYLAIGVR